MNDPCVMWRGVPALAVSSPSPVGKPDVIRGGPMADLRNIAFADDLRRLLRRKVESGQFSSEEYVVVEALRRFLLEGSDERHPQTGSATEPQEERLPGPFIEDETVLAPG